MATSRRSERHMGLYGATALGVDAIVGGGILALAGVAFATAGPGAIAAFALNGVIAAITVASFARLARRFLESGGIYTYAKRVLSIQVAFMVGWVVWFASIVAVYCTRLALRPSLWKAYSDCYRPPPNHMHSWQMEGAM